MPKLAANLTLLYGELDFLDRFGAAAKSGFKGVEFLFPYPFGKDELAEHLQLADTPGRHEPGTGEINFSFLLDFIDRLGYEGWIGCEYKPGGETRVGLGWAKPHLFG